MCMQDAVIIIQWCVRVCICTNLYNESAALLNHFAVLTFMPSDTVNTMYLSTQYKIQDSVIQFVFHRASFIWFERFFIRFHCIMLYCSLSLSFVPSLVTK